MILETIITTLSPQGVLNVAPMGPVVSGDLSASNELIDFDLKPFDTSTTYQNLRQHPHGVLHINDDVLLFARAAVGKLTSEDYACLPAEDIKGQIIQGSCRAYEFQVDFFSPDAKRPILKCRVIKQHRYRDFWGFNRARHSVLEAAILATRLDFLPLEKISEEFERLEIIVAKTGGQNEVTAFEFLKAHIKAYSESITQA